MNLRAALMRAMSTPPVGLDTDAQAYLTAAAITAGNTYWGSDLPIASNQIIKVVNSLFVNLKTTPSDTTGVSMYERLAYFYPLLGTLQSYVLINAKNPGTRDITPVGTPTAPFGRLGLALDANSVYSFNTLLSEFPDYSYSVGFYVNGGTGGYDFGVLNDAANTLFCAALGQTIWLKDGGHSISYTNPQILGLNQVIVTASNKGVYRIKDIQENLFSSVGDSSYTENDLLLGNYNTGTGGASGKTCGFLYVAEGLSDNEALLLYGIIEKFCVGIARGHDLTWQFFGDSYTEGAAGINITYHWRSWPSQLAINKNYTEINLGAGGTTIVDGIGSTLETSAILPKNVYNKKIAISYGINDCTEEIDISTYTADYTTAINNVLSQGYLASDILIITGWYCGDGSGTGTGRTDVGSDLWYAAYADYRTAAASVASSFGITNAFDLHDIVVAAGGATLIEGIHMTVAGHAVVASYLEGVVSF